MVISWMGLKSGGRGQCGQAAARATSVINIKAKPVQRRRCGVAAVAPPHGGCAACVSDKTLLSSHFAINAREYCSSRRAADTHTRAQDGSVGQQRQWGIYKSANFSTHTGT